MLILNPILVAYGTILQKQLQVLGPVILNFYVAALGFVVFAFVMIINQYGLGFF